MGYPALGQQMAGKHSAGSSLPRAVFPLPAGAVEAERTEADAVEVGGPAADRVDAEAVRVCAAATGPARTTSFGLAGADDLALVLS